MTAMPFMNETGLVPGTEGLALNSFNTMSEPAMYQRRSRLHPRLYSPR